MLAKKLKIDLGMVKSFLLSAIRNCDCDIVEDSRRGEAIDTFVLLHVEEELAREDVVIFADISLLPFDIDHFIIHEIIESREDIVVLVVIERIRERVLPYSVQDEGRTAIYFGTFDEDII